MSDATHLLLAIEQGDPHAAGELLPLVYEQLRKLAVERLARERAGQTLQPTALVHEAYLRLVPNGDATRSNEPRWDSRGHFFAAAAEAMRRILVESARRKKRVKHGGSRVRMVLLDNDVAVQPLTDDILALDEALKRLAEEDPEVGQIVQLHFFAGLSMEQTAESLGISRATAYRQWSYARAWLRCSIGE